MKLQVFNGGQSSKMRPQFIEANQGVVYENIDYDAGTLTPINMPKETDVSVKQYHQWFNAGARWVDSDNPRDYVEFQKTLYWTDRSTRPQKLSMDGVQTGLGIDMPPKLTSFNLTKNPKGISDVKIEPLSQNTGLPMEVQYYLLINQDANGYSNAFHFQVDTRDRVTTIAQSTNDPQIRPKVDSSSTSSAKRQVRISNIKGVTAGSVGYKLFRQYAGKFYLVGLFTSTITDATENISSNEQLDYDLFGKLDGVYTYVLTYVNNNDGSESAPSTVSSELDLEDGGYITVNEIPIATDPQVTHKRLYRVGGLLGEFTQVTQISNYVTSFVDNIKDSEVPGHILDTTTAYPAPSGLKYLQEAYAMLFGVLDTKLRFTPVGKPDQWPESYYLQFDAPLTGIAPVANGILVFTQFRTYIVTGTGPTSLSQYLLSSDQGCIAYESVQLIATEAVWASTDGLCSSSGNRPIVITKNKLGKITLNPIDSAIYDETYYLMEANNKILSYKGDIVARYDFNVSSLALANDSLYGYRDGKLWELFTGSDPAYFSFESALFTEGKFTANKTYKKIFLYSRGRVIINILINNVVVQTKELEGEDSFTIQVPQDLQRGFFIQFKIEGTGEVSELEYVIGDQTSG
jgi:hypothetical protein